MCDYAIRVKNVSKMYKLYSSNKARIKDAFGLGKNEYREHYALHNMSFDVARGETVGLIGTNGAGKSTMLKIVTGVVSPTEGEIEVNGRISALLELGAGFNPEYTGVENIYLNGTMMGFSRDEIAGRIDEILQFADIGDFAYQPVKSYSSGMFVRLAFAVAINIEPEILIVDEALSVGDVFFQAKCFRKFEEFKKMGKTILFVSHDMNSMSKYCDRVILLDHGNKVAEGSSKEIIDLYKKLTLKQTVLKLENSKGEVEETESKTIKEDAESPSVHEASLNHENTWKQYFETNPNVDEYGSGKAQIVDYAVIDSYGNLTTTLEKGSSFRIKSKARFNVDIEDPIFTYTFKNVQGVSITGTNTMFEKVDIPLAKEGEEYVCTFEQTMNLQGGEYLLSISITGHKDGEFQVYHRMYDLLNITVVSDKDTVGFYDMNSKVNIERA